MFHKVFPTEYFTTSLTEIQLKSFGFFTSTLLYFKVRYISIGLSTKTASFFRNKLPIYINPNR